MREKYLIATDLDGTLLTEDGVYKGLSREYFKFLKEQGQVVVIATGRTLARTRNALGNLDFMDYIIANSGSIIYDVKNDNIIYSKEIDRLELDKVTPILLSRTEKIQIRDLYTQKSVELKDYCDKLEKIDNISMVIAHPKVGNDINTIKSEFENVTDKICFNVMMDSFADNKWFNINNFETSKFNAIEWLRNKLGIDSEHIITFGDGLNDIVMIKGYDYGVAVNNALPEVKEVAKYITDDDQELGVLNFLKDFFGE